MNLLQLLRDKFLAYCESDQVTDLMMRDEYFYLLQVSGLYPNLSEKFRVLSVMQFLINFGLANFHMYVMLNTLLVISKLNFTLLTFIFQIFMLMQFCCFVLLVFNYKRHVIIAVCREIGEPFVYEGEDHEGLLKELAADISSEKKRLMILPVCLCLIGGNCMLLGPFIDSIYGDPGFNQTEAGFFTGIPIAGVYPWHIPDNMKTFHFYLLGSLQLLSAFFLVSLIASATIVFLNLLYAYIYHARYLIHNIRSIESRAEELFSRTYLESPMSMRENIYEDRRFLNCFEGCIKKNFRHHQKTIRMYELIQDILSWLIGYAYFTGTIVIALSLLSAKTGVSLPGTAATSFMMCIMEVCIMAMISFLGQRVTDLNEELRFAVYCMKWYMIQRSIKLDVTILQEMTLRPLELKGFGLVVCNLDTFANVINSAYSYYSLIMAV